MYYVGAYIDEVCGKTCFSFVGWSKSKLAMMMYNIAGHTSGAFYDHYEIFEYDCTKEEFIQIVLQEWDEDISNWENSESYIKIYETRHDDYLSMSNGEYDQLILYTDIDYEMASSYMRTLYKIIGSDVVALIRDTEVSTFIGHLSAIYMSILNEVEDNQLSSRIDKLQSFICKVRDDMFYEIYGRC